MSLAGEKEFKMGITYCGRVVCQDCAVKLEETNWVECCGVCNGAIALNYGAPPMVVNLFQDIPSQIKTITKIVTFQEKQKQSIRNHLSEKKRDYVLEL